jgi:hypothetical protein
MTDVGLKQSSADPVLYIGNKGLAGAVHVDDLIVKAVDTNTLVLLTKELRLQLEMKDIGRPSLILSVTCRFVC